MYNRRDIAVLGMLVLLCLGVSAAGAQWSGYISSTQGYNTNPLYNYATQSDQLNQSYLELNWALGEYVSRGTIGYIGSLTLFNQLSDRNYYEHVLQGEYVRLFPKREWAGDDGGPPSEKTFFGNTLTLQAKLGARHDRDIYREYDNYGGAATVSYKAMMGGGAFTAGSNEIGFRRYLNVPDLSNILDVAQVRVGGSFTRGLEGSLVASAGVKHFTSQTIDTSTVEVATTSTSPGTGNGNGNGNGKKISGTTDPGQGSSKKNAIVVNPTSVNAFILGVGGDFEAKWTSGSVRAEAMVRFNLSDSARYVAQFANTLGLGEDIYNDFFSYRGPEVKLIYTQTLPLGLSLRLAGEYAHRTFLAPAFDLQGVQVAGNRVDIRTSGEVILSRNFALTEALSVDVTFAGAVVFSSSNDQYNDYAVRNVSLGIGFGF
jgi:hypothetical protein